MVCLGVDFGRKRIGLSIGDDLGVATPLPAANQPCEEERLAFIGGIILERAVTNIVVGYPLNMDGTAGFKARETDVFIAGLERRFHLPVHRVDERLTTYAAAEDEKVLGKKRARNMGSLRARRKSGDIDSRAASLILQDFLDQATRSRAKE